MANFQDTVAASARRHTRWRFPSYADDISQEVWVALLEEEELPETVVKWIDQIVRRIVGREHKRLGRDRNRRHFPLVPDNDQRAAKDQRASNPLEECIERERGAVIQYCIANSVDNEFDRETVRVLSEQHPHYTSFRQLANAKFPGPLSSAYRALKSLVARIESQLEQRIQSTCDA